MQTVARHNFTTVKTEGAILPADLLQRIAGGKLEGLQPAYYHLAPGERLNEAITRAWNRCQGVWETFNDQRQQLPESDSGVSLTRERWLLILFQELGYGRLAFQPRGLELPEDQSSIRYPISHLWQQTPIHLVSFRQELDRRDPTIKRSPHSLIQEFLNRSDEHLWGFVSNGLSLQILRDNISLTRAAYVEFDLEKMMTEQVYADFTLLWLICHQSRVEIRPADDQAPISSPQSPANCWLEKWSQQATEQGTRALDALRNGVQEAIAALGRGFLAHPGTENERLRQKLRSGVLSRDDYFRQLLRLVYRLIFLFVAEDRDLLLLPEADEQARHRYATYYSAGRLRRLAEARRGGPHPDLYRTLRRVFFLLRAGYPDLGLPALGSFLFSERSTPALDECDIANTDLLNAIRALAFTVEGQVTRPVDYKNLGAEELGSVYESLLELHPFLNIEAATFTLEVAAGSERKTTGSYYTPSSLINSLLDSALEPVVADRLQVTGGKSQGGAALEEALLSIKVVDPACGSGHFLIAAANRLAAHLARIRTGDDEPSPTARREALRDVVHHCIHGVDINEMAVELCKVGLWMETIDPGKPLGFLERNIRCGNSLIGATPALLRQGIPDEAFTPITGDDSDYCKEWKARNKEERKGQLSMRFGEAPWQRLGDLATAMAELDRMGDKTLADVRAQEEAYAKMMLSSDYENSHLWADTWCAAFVWQKNNRFDYPITEQTFRKIEHNPFDIAPWMKKEIKRLRDEYQFFHWYLIFPHVFHPQTIKTEETAKASERTDVTGWTGGFDVVLGNPPWEASELAEREYFASKDSEVANARTQSERKKLISKLGKSNPSLFAEWNSVKRKQACERLFLNQSGFFPLTSKGKLNTYRLFAGLGEKLLAQRGMFGMVLKSGIITAQSSQAFISSLSKKSRIHLVVDFINTKQIFPDIVANERFCLFVFGGEAKSAKSAKYAFTLETVQEIDDPTRNFSLSSKELRLLNPNDLSIPPIAASHDKDLLLKIYTLHPALVRPGQNPWMISYTQGHNNSATGSSLFANNTLENLLEAGGTLAQNAHWAMPDGKRLLPVYEGKYIAQLNHRFGTFEGVSAKKRFGIKAETNDPSLGDMQDPRYEIVPRYWMNESDAEALYERKNSYHNWLFVFRDICRAIVDARTVQSCIMPRLPCNDGCPILLFDKDNDNAAFSGLFFNTLWASFIFDYAARQKIHGAHLTKAIAYQLPVPLPESLKQTIGNTIFAKFIILRGIELSFVTYSLKKFAEELGYLGPPFRWDEDRRFLLRCELDAAYFHLYGIERGDVAYIMDTFPIVRRKNEDAFGEYRTKRVILEIYDEMAEAIRTGQSYQTRLDPPPADLRAAHAWDESYLGPYRDPSTWWREVETAKDEKVIEGETAVTYQPQSVTSVSHSVKEPAPTFQLRSPAPPTKKEETTAPPTTHATQQPLLDVAPAPTGPRSRRLKQAMVLGRDSSPSATRELVAFLADEDSNIRWLAGSSLVQRANSDVVAAIASFLDGAEAERVAVARPEMQRVLGLIAETAESEAVRERARETRKQSQTSASQE